MKPLVIADIGSNFSTPEGASLERAKKLIRAAATAGAGAAKFQLLRGNKLVRSPEMQKKLASSELPTEWLPGLKSFTEELGMVFLCTPFYLEAVDVLEELDVEAYKIASWDLNYTPLLEKIRETGKGVILSTGAATILEVEGALDILRPEGASDGITLMHCTGGYPTPMEDLQIRNILDLASTFYPIPVGFSSHIVNPDVVAATTWLGAKTFEVHLDLQDGAGKETSHSYNPKQLMDLVRKINQYSLAWSCECTMTLSDTVARNNYYRDPSDWLRPPLRAK